MNLFESVTKADFGQTSEGKKVEVYTVRNSKGMAASITTYGGIVQSLFVPDKNGKFDDVVLGYDDLPGYLKSSSFFGALIGRYGNRIGGAKFTLDGKTYTLAANDGPNSLHGGLVGFDKVFWTARPLPTLRGPALILTYVSKNGEESFPGNLEVTAICTLTEDNELQLEFTAKTDEPTMVNLTHHSYFNLAGQGNGDILGHQVYINADQITPVDAGLIPTGEFGLQARVVEPASGRVMEVWSDEPGLQFYTGNFLDGSIKGKGGAAYPTRAGFCMEPQHYPDSPNQPNFPAVVLRPGQTYRNLIVYKFLIAGQTEK